ncbi:DUF1830 domain-containing protein [Romeria aff. gracilis LEGE 07310]|uniref:DUF1830 domain-containing protein n=1 Tax=Vasconcelosia minhoensis LEGE 07310 TaxID=915328 RepID=A0A8J7DMC8_9CYAN|nr:DUF1830 domain-containing protein [Romeria gracilis]MBE9078516.1 DUF1830 domain-containing protein [Romeria aff. gracilis LEGE 07310]
MVQLNRAIERAGFFDSERILCFYVNTTGRTQIIRVTLNAGFYWEKVEFPLQKIFFEASEAASLEVHVGRQGEKTLIDLIPCQQLRISQGSGVAS